MNKYEIRSFLYELTKLTKSHALFSVCFILGLQVVVDRYCSDYIPE